MGAHSLPRKFIKTTIRDIAASLTCEDWQPSVEAAALGSQLPREAIEMLLILHPIIVIAGRGNVYQLVGGARTFKIARTVLDLDKEILAIELGGSEPDIELLSAVEQFAVPVLMSPPNAPAIVRRWMNALVMKGRSPILQRLGLKRMSQAGLAALLGVSRERLRRAARPTPPATPHD